MDSKFCFFFSQVWVNSNGCERNKTGSCGLSLSLHNMGNSTLMLLPLSVLKPCFRWTVSRKRRCWSFQKHHGWSSSLYTQSPSKWTCARISEQVLQPFCLSSVQIPAASFHFISLQRVKYLVQNSPPQKDGFVLTDSLVNTPQFHCMIFGWQQLIAVALVIFLPA